MVTAFAPTSPKIDPILAQELTHPLAAPADRINPA